jgi:cytochrome c553
MRRTGALLLAGLLVLASSAAAGPEPARGKALAEVRQCGACHGADGVAQTAGVPSLAAMPGQVVVLQLILMREKLRQVPAMAPFAEGLTDAEIEDLGAWFESLPPGLPADRAPVDATKLAAGAALSQKGRCGICHLPDYRGREQMPRLAGQREDYLRQALTQFRDSQRIGTDTQMTGLLHGYSDADLAALAHYMAHRDGGS